MNNPIESIPLVWNRPVDPSSAVGAGRRCRNPVTIEDLEGGYMTCGFREIKMKDGCINMESLQTDLDRWHHPSLAPGESSGDLSSHHFGAALWPRITFLDNANWKEAVDEIARRKLVVLDCWGMIPGLKEGRQGGLGWTIPDEVQKYMNDRLGRRFLGWDNGENDGRWFWQSLRLDPTPVDRKKVFEYFDGWFRPFLSDLQNHANALCGLTYPHYFARMEGHRMIGAEFLQALPSVPMWAGWVRGAARQYQMLWIAGISCFDMFGYKTFEEDVFKGDSAGKEEMGIGNPSNQTGPDRGHSISMLKRTWYLLFMYGVNIESFEMSQFVEEHHLSALGKVQLAATRFGVKNKTRRGVQYCPVALLLDYHSGWVPPRHFYSDSFYTVWGGIPYEKGDHQVDLFFREMYPGYQDCALFQDERGFLTPTPYGDIVDVLLSDMSSHILARYRAAFIAGEIVVQGEVLEKLEKYVEAGGKVIWSLSQLGPDARALAGITSVGVEKRATRSHNPQDGSEYPEDPFGFNRVDLCGAEVLLDDGEGHPLVICKPVGEGEIITMIPPFGLTDRVAEAHPLVGADPERDITTIHFHNKALGSPYRILNGIKATVFTRLASLNLIEVEASPDPILDVREVARRVSLQYVTNVTAEPAKLVITLLNNESFYVYARVGIKNARIVTATDLLHPEKSLPVKEGGLSLTFFPAESVEYNMYIIELQMDRPIVEFLRDAA